MKKKVGFIGLGQMGKWMALNLVRKGFPLHVYDLKRQAVQQLARKGAKGARSLAELAQTCRQIILSLPDSQVVEKVLFGENGLGPHLQKGHVIIDCGTSHPLFTRQTFHGLKRRGIAFLDAPVSGMESRARQGTLTIMVGGDEAAYRRTRPLLSAMGKDILYMGGSGNGQLAKMTNNVLFNISCAAMAEILPMAAKMRLDPEKVCSVVSSGTGQSYGFDFFSRLALDGNFKPGYPMKSAYKDMATAMEIAGKYQFPLPVTSAAVRTYQMALAQGLGKQNKGAMIKVWEKKLGIRVRRKRA